MKLAEVFTMVVPEERGLGFKAFDGSAAGAPSQLRLARAHVAGDLEIVCDPFEAMMRLYPSAKPHIGIGEWLRLVGKFLPAALKRPTPPPQEQKLTGSRHSKGRDAEAIHHHYDVSNRFYRLVLGPSMAYTCAVFPNADASLEIAQDGKFDLICRKLGLRPGMTLLDIDCGWGGMVLHAVKHYGVKAIGVTVSERQAEWRQEAIEALRMAGQAQIRFSDYRDVPEAGFDAISSIGLTEYIGRESYFSYFVFAFAFGKFKPEGRMLNHTIIRPSDAEPSHYRDSFINRNVFPEGELSGPGHIMSTMNDAGFEIHHEENLHEHYALTLKHWCQNLEDHWDEAVEEAGLGSARAWRLHLAASRMGFELNTIQLHQTLGVRLAARGVSGFPLRPDFGTQCR